MRQAIARWMMRPWVYRISCLVIFLGAMFVLRLGLIALRNTGDRTLMATVCLPIGFACIAFAFWYDRRRGY